MLNPTSLRSLSDHTFTCFQALKSVVLYVILAPYDNEQSDLVHRINTDKKLEELPKYRYAVLKSPEPHYKEVGTLSVVPLTPQEQALVVLAQRWLAPL